MRKKIIRMLLITSACLSCIGCNFPLKTPASNQVEPGAVDSSHVKSQETYFVPEHIDSKGTYNSLHLIFDADIVVPSLDSLCTAQVARMIYSNEDYQSFMDYFCPAAKWINEPQQTKSQIEDLISKIKQESDENNAQQQDLNYLYSLLDDAPEEASITEFSFDSKSESTEFKAYTPNSSGSYASFWGQYNGNTYQYTRDANTIVMREEYLEPNDSLASCFTKNVSISKDAALEIAEETLAALNVDKNIKLLYGNKAIAFSGIESLAIGWDFVFTRNNNGLQTPYVDYFDLWSNSAAPVNYAPWDSEFYFVFVDENGVYRLYVRGAGQQIICVDNDVELLAFDQIVEKIKTQLIAQHELPSGEKQVVLVKEITLCSALVNIDDDENIGMSIPSWEVIYYIGDGTSFDKSEAYELTTFFSAIDGSYIEPRICKDVVIQAYG